MSFEFDLPIEDGLSDCLRRNALATTIADTIVAMKNDNSSMVIGIQGSWGCGKTSVINLIKNMLKEPQRHDNVIVCSLNSWMATDRESLLNEFFCEFMAKTEQSVSKAVTTREFFSGCLVALKNYAQNLVKNVSINFGGPGLQMHMDGAVLLPIINKSLNRQKDELATKIKKLDYSIVYFIDDIDRLNYTEIATLFQLVKNLADFPNVTYVLCYDKEIVAAALEKVQPGFGRQYIEKVVQVPIDLPVATGEELYKYLYERLQGAVVAYGKQPDCFDSVYFKDVFDKGLVYLFNTIRDCNRVLNAFNFKYSLCKNNVDAVDLFAITAIEIFEPELYKFIQFDAVDFWGELPAAYLEDFEDLLYQNVISPDKDCIVKIIGMLFPNMMIDEGKRVVADRKFSDKRMHRISCPQYFYRYILLRLGNNAVTKDVVDDLVKKYSFMELISVMSDFNSRGVIKDFFEEVGNLVANIQDDEFVKCAITDNRIKELMTAILQFDDLEDKSGENVQAGSKREFLIRQLVNKFYISATEESFVTAITEIVQNDKISLISVSKLVNYAEQNFSIYWADDAYVADFCPEIPEINDKCVGPFRGVFRDRIIKDYQETLEHNSFTSGYEEMMMKKLWEMYAPEMASETEEFVI